MGFTEKEKYILFYFPSTKEKKINLIHKKKN